MYSLSIFPMKVRCHLNYGKAITNEYMFRNIDLLNVLCYTFLGYDNQYYGIIIDSL
jgi:hypothetical protein